MTLRLLPPTVASRPGVLLLLLSLVAHTASAAPPVDPATLAQARFDRGKVLQAKGQHDAALDELAASLALFDSPNARLLLARSLIALGRLDEAYVELGRAERVAADLATRARRYASTRAAAAQERRELEPRIARVRLEVRSSSAGVALSGMELQLDGHVVPVDALGLELSAMPGAHRLEARAERHEVGRLDLTLAAGELHVVSLVLPYVVSAAPSPAAVATPAVAPPVAPSPEPDRPHLAASQPAHDPASIPALVAVPVEPSGTTAATYLVGGGLVAAGLGAATFTVFGLLARDTHATLAAGCPEGCSVSEAATDGRTQQTVANVALAVGITGLVVGGGAWLWSAIVDDDSGEPTTPPRGAADTRAVLRP
jgi:hypothetical protein